MSIYDVVVIGAGPGGLAAAISAKKNGTERVLVLERNEKVGGILNQCIHDGFGLVRYNETFTGPEYAEKANSEAISAGVDIMTDSMVIGLTQDKVITAVSSNGLFTIKASAIVLATGCRERTRGNIQIPGDRPAGVFTAGVVQNLINVKNIMIGRRVVILGSGDIGLIMARRLFLEGAEVIAVVEIMKEPCGLQRNVSQCLNDFNIPIYTSQTISRIIGRRKLEAVEISSVDDQFQVIPETTRRVDCDSLVLSVGLIPENELASMVGLKLNEQTNGISTDEFLQSDIPGFFACGNCIKVMDLADFVSKQGEVAGTNASCFISGKEMTSFEEEKYLGFKKGFPTKGSTICPLCPNGCSITKGTNGFFTGNKCRRGLEYAKLEAVSPKRILTTTIKQSDGSLRPIKIVGVNKSNLRETVNQLKNNNRIMKRVLVSGGAGYIGSVLVKLLLKEGYKVRVIDILRFGGESIVELLNDDNFEFIKGDIRNKEDLLKAINDVDYAVNLAAIVGDPACAKEPELAKSTNINGGMLFYDTANEMGVRKFIMASTCSNYGKMENPNEFVTETSKLAPVSLYAETKVKMEKYLLSRPKDNICKPTCLRFSTVYGLSPRIRFDLTVNEFAKDLAMGKELLIFGEQFWRPYCHVVDLCRGVIAVLQASDEEVAYDVFNVGCTEENYTKKMIVDEITKFLPNTKVKYVQKNEDPRDYRVSFEKIKQRLGFTITKRVPDGIKQIITVAQSGFLNNPDEQKYKNI